MILWTHGLWPEARQQVSPILTLAQFLLFLGPRVFRNNRGEEDQFLGRSKRTVLALCESIQPPDSHRFRRLGCRALRIWRSLGMPGIAGRARRPLSI